MADVLVVDDNPLQARHLQFILLEAGHQVSLAADGLEAMNQVRQTRPELVITDMHMPQMNGLELVAALRQDFPGLPVILCTSQGSEELAIEALRAGASSYVPKRRLADEIVPILEEVLSVVAYQKMNVMFLSRLTSLENRFVLENDPELVPQVVSHVETVMMQLNLFDEAERVRVGVAVHEALINAIVHGNLEIDSELKVGDWQAYHDRIRQRSQEQPYRDRTVSIVIRASRGPYLEVRIADQGPGFDLNMIQDATEVYNLERSSGRGLLLIRTFFDHVQHNSVGNEIVMTKGKAAP